MTLSFGAFAQQRLVYQVDRYSNHKQERREVGRSQNYDSKSFDYRGLDLSNKQKRELDDLIFRMHQDIKVVQRNFRYPESQIRRIEKNFDLKISKMLTKYQYDKFMRMYAYKYQSFGYGRV